MNQSILINDDMTWNCKSQRIEFTALYSGAIIQCILTMEYLTNKGFDGEIQSRSINEFCNLISFDIEEDTQQAIEEEQLDDNGQIILS